MNPYTILGGILVWGASLAGAGWWAHGVGVNAQKVADQAIFDRYETASREQETAANNLLHQKEQELIELVLDREALTNQLEKTHASAQRTTNALRGELAGERLRFAAREDSCGKSGGSTSRAGPDSASNPAPALVELPAEIEGRLRELAYDADTLRDDYALLYGWSHAVKCSAASP